MALDVEGVVDRGMSGEEALSRRLALEQLLLSLPSSDRQARVLRAIVLSEPARAMKVSQAEFVERSAVRTQAVGDDRLRMSVKWVWSRS